MSEIDEEQAKARLVKKEFLPPEGYNEYYMTGEFGEEPFENRRLVVVTEAESVDHDVFLRLTGKHKEEA